MWQFATISEEFARGPTGRDGDFFHGVAIFYNCNARQTGSIAKKVRKRPENGYDGVNLKMTGTLNLKLAAAGRPCGAIRQLRTAPRAASSSTA